MPVQPKPHLAALSRATHGGVTASELRELGLDARDVLDFSVNTNPFGPAPRALRAVREADVSRYPDPEAQDLRGALAEALEAPVDCVLPGNGSVELVWLTALAYLSPGDSALVIGPTFGEYEAAARAAGGQVLHSTALPARRFAPDMEEVASILSEKGPRVVFLCNPNNPTGTFLAPKRVRALASAHPDALFVVDEAYLPFMESGADLSPQPPLHLGLPDNLIVLRSMTKDCAIPGLRLGYAIAPEHIIAALRAVQPPWSVNALAQAAGLAALEDGEHLRRSMGAIAEAKAYLTDALAGLGLDVLPSSTNFFLLRVENGADLTPAAFREELLREGCCVRDCASFGLPDYVRIGVRTLPECERLVGAVAKVLSTFESVRRAHLAR